MADFITILGYILAPIAAVVTWIASRRKRQNDFLVEMQSSIDLLITKNKELTAEIVALRSENMQLQTRIEELNHKLENVKTITKKV
jgi:predicted RNase H-like nuclease (RuvC/YqgF family)